MNDSNIEGGGLRVVLSLWSSEAEFSVVKTEAIPEVTEVRFYASTVGHITRQHPELAGELPSVFGAILDTVARPTAVYRSRTSPAHSFVYESTRNSMVSSAMLVPVKLVESTSARVTTAYFSTDPYEGQLIWQGGQDDQ
jgi:hypothetical protein